MNNNIPGWDFERDTFVTNQKKPIGQDQELVELLWQNGQVVMHSQTQRKPVMSSIDLTQIQKTDQEQETVSWIQNNQYPLAELFEQEFCSNLLSEIATCEVESNKSIPNENSSSQVPNMKNNPVPAPPRFNEPDSSKKVNNFVGSQKVLNAKFPHFSASHNVLSASGGRTQFGEKVTSNVSQSEVRECPVMTVGSSHCGSNQIPIKDCVQGIISRSDEKGKSEMVETSVTSSSGGSGSSIGRTCSLISTRNQGQKRKGIDAAEASEELSEATELKSGDGNKASQRTGSSRRNRVAEVHNLSERRRRDRINEKMRALQQLIPNSNKTDKASMLEEAIEYLKSLQLQLQVMWMGTGMTPLMFQGIQHFMSQMSSMGMASSPSLPSINNNNPMQQLPRVPPHHSSPPLPQIPNQSLMMCQNPVSNNAFNYQNQMQNPCLSDQFAPYMGYHLMQSASQAMNVFRYGSHEQQAEQHSSTIIAPSNGSGSMNETTNIDHSVRGKMSDPLNT